MKKVILTTGGTGGHIYPALAIADMLKEKGVESLFVGTSIRMEKDMVPNAGFRFIGLNISPPNKLKNILKYFKAIGQSFKIIREEKPDAIIGFGNYISIPIVLAGLILRKKVYLQEQNANMGRANQLFYKFVKKTFLAFEKTYNDIPIKYQKKFKVTGNPLRKSIKSYNYTEERNKMKLGEEERVILITGGSLGAKEINDSVVKYWDKFVEDKNLRVYWATGEKNYKEVIEKIEKKKNTDVIKPYFEDILSIMAASDLIICRAGALTISEIIELSKPSIIIPYGQLKVGQYANAEIMAENKSSLMFTRFNIDEAIGTALELIKNENELSRMRARIRSLKKSEATQDIVSSIDIWEKK